MRTQEEKARVFRELHAGAPFVIPNPWDVGSARVLEALGFPALATTSSGFAFTLGRLDGKATLDEVVAHVGALAAATEVPVSVDLENGYAEGPDGVARAIERVAEAGAVGASIEDYDPGRGLYARGEAVERLAAGVEAARALPVPFILVGRAENHIRGNPDLDDTIARLRAFEEAGAGALYAPGLRDLDDVRAVCGALEKPVNVLALPGMPVSELFEAGAQRVSVGGGLAWIAVGAMVKAAQPLLEQGELSRPATALDLQGWLAG
jgi:2-methylisocitrate lyase-like PEP mutase family enzyme